MNPDEDLQSLLEQLSPDDPKPTPAPPPAQVVPTPEDIDKIGTKSAAAVAELTEIAPPPATVDVHKYLHKLDDVTDEILASCRSDRQEAQDVINMFRNEIEQSINQNRPPQRMYVDGLVQAVEVKANINMTAVKIIEANAKMLAATKVTGNVMVNNVNVAGGGAGGVDNDLEKILDEPITKMDEY